MRRIHPLVSLIKDPYGRYHQFWAGVALGAGVEALVVAAYTMSLPVLVIGVTFLIAAIVKLKKGRVGSRW